MKAMGLNSITYALRSAKAEDAVTEPFAPPDCPEPLVLGLQWPQPAASDLSNLKALFDLAASKGMRIRLGLQNVHTEEQPPSSAQIWLGAILGAIGKHPALDVITFDGNTLLLDTTAGPNTACGIPGEAPLWLGTQSLVAQYVGWAIAYARSLGVPASKLSAEAMAGFFSIDGQPSNPFATDGHLWNPVLAMKGIFDEAGISNDQRTYALSFYEQRKCKNAGTLPCSDLDPHSWAEQTLQTMEGIIGAANSTRVIATEMGSNTPVDPAWKTEWAMESLATLLEKYGIEGGSFWRWTSFSNCQSGCPNEDADPTLADPVKRRGVEFITYLQVRNLRLSGGQTLAGFRGRMKTLDPSSKDLGILRHGPFLTFQKRSVNWIERAVNLPHAELPEFG